MPIDLDARSGFTNVYFILFESIYTIFLLHVYLSFKFVLTSDARLESNNCYIEQILFFHNRFYISYKFVLELFWKMA